jgi:3-hydroxyacyl-CoA dehydrogenase
MKYPCRDCIVMPVCSELCNKLNKVLTPKEVDHIMTFHTCVDCGGTECFDIHGHDTWLICSTCYSSYLFGTGYKQIPNSNLIRRFIKSTNELIPGTHTGTIPISKRVSFWRSIYEISMQGLYSEDVMY